MLGRGLVNPLALLVANALIAFPAAGQPVGTKGDKLERGVTMTDYETFFDLSRKMRPIADDLAGFMMRPPISAGIGSAVRTQNCMIRLAGVLDDFQDRFSSMTNLIGLSAKMVDEQDRVLVTGMLGIEVSGFITNTKFSLEKIDLTTQYSDCVQDGATIAKSQEIKRTLKEADKLAQELAIRMGVKALKLPANQ